MGITTGTNCWKTNRPLFTTALFFFGRKTEVFRTKIIEGLWGKLCSFGRSKKETFWAKYCRRMMPTFEKIPSAIYWRKFWCKGLWGKCFRQYCRQNLHHNKVQLERTYFVVQTTNGLQVDVQWFWNWTTIRSVWVHVFTSRAHACMSRIHIPASAPKASPFPATHPTIVTETQSVDRKRYHYYSSSIVSFVHVRTILDACPHALKIVLERAGAMYRLLQNLWLRRVDITGFSWKL